MVHLGDITKVDGGKIPSVHVITFGSPCQNPVSYTHLYIERLCRFPLLIIDDFGMERGTEYGLEQVYNVIDSRYRSRKPLIVTTNLTLDLSLIHI